MKKYLSNNWSTGLTIIGILLLTFLFGIGIMTTPVVNYTYSIFDLGTKFSYSQDTIFIFSLVIIILFFLTLVPVALAILSLFKKKSGGMLALIFYQLAFQIIIITLQSLYQVVTPGIMAYAIINIILVIASFTLYILRIKYLEVDSASTLQKEELPVNIARIVKAILIFDVIQVLVLGLVFFIPMYSTFNGVETTIHILISSGSGASSDILDMVYFLSFFIAFLVSLFFLIYSISSYISNKKQFVANSKSLVSFNLIISLAFFLCGYITSFVYSLQGTPASTISFIPLLVIGLSLLPFFYFKGKYDVSNLTKVVRKRKERYFKVETLIYVSLITVMTFVSLFLNVIIVEITYSGTEISNVALNGYQLLQQYASLGASYQYLALYVVAMLVISGVAFIWTIASYLSKYKNFGKVAKITTYTNVIMVMLLGISGLYFAIAREVNLDNLKKLLEYNHISYSEDFTYSMRSDMVYGLIADVIILVVMLFRKAFDVEPFSQESGLLALPGLGGSSSSLSSSEAEPSQAGNSEPTSPSEGSGNKSSDDLPPTFDPCPSFSFLDMQKEEFLADQEKRKVNMAKSPSLSGLVSFVVDYAKNSRLHLSYTKQDIASFISGLAACRLTILQGMSGTGKTSLPKIFSEAINGNCYLVEVESSWKDKNELLGYYNEFSMMYTPKKFTLSLYKTTLMKEVPTFIVLDEMNLSRIEYYFSDFLSLMENEEDKRDIKLLNVNLSNSISGVKVPYSSLKEGNSLHIPSNLWFIGTANRDESTFGISDKVYDRANTMNFNKRAPKVKGETTPIKQEYYTYEMLATLFENAKKSGTFDADKSDIIAKVEQILRPFNISFGNRILNQIEDFVDVYCACFPKKDVEAEALETILLSKVVSKLEVKTIDDKQDLIDSFKNLNLDKCADFISSLNED